MKIKIKTNYLRDEDKITIGSILEMESKEKIEFIDEYVTENDVVKGFIYKGKYFSMIWDDKDFYLYSDELKKKDIKYLKKLFKILLKKTYQSNLVFIQELFDFDEISNKEFWKKIKKEKRAYKKALKELN
jgi:hypothetical protein